ncbi:MAG: hypothetical protein LBF54_03680 [Holosporaceae bacterium]|jgi:hypothetical protein|nr:hypothetical protein [Holosporaceae bacterium]
MNKILLFCCSLFFSCHSFAMLKHQKINIDSTVILSVTSKNLAAYYNEVAPKIWKNYGILGKYNPKALPLAKKEAISIQSENLGSLVGFCRAHLVLSGNLLQRMWEKVNYLNLPKEIQSILKSQKLDISRDKSIPNKLLLFCSVKLPWNKCMETLQPIFKEGSLSHEYSIEEALFILYAHPETPGLFARSHYAKERRLYERCVAASLMRILQEEGVEPEVGRAWSTETEIDNATKAAACAYIKALSKSD